MGQIKWTTINSIKSWPSSEFNTVYIYIVGLENMLRAPGETVDFNRYSSHLDWLMVTFEEKHLVMRKSIIFH